MSMFEKMSNEDISIELCAKYMECFDSHCANLLEEAIKRINRLDRIEKGIEKIAEELNNGNTKL